MAKGWVSSSGCMKKCRHQLTQTGFERLPLEVSATKFAPAVPGSPLTLHAVHLSFT